MAHLVFFHTRQDTLFASQLAIQLQQRGLVVRPLPDPLVPDRDQSAEARSELDSATHVLAVFSVEAAASGEMRHDCEHVLDLGKHLIVILHQTCDLPERIASCPVVDFRGQFLLAVEDLVQLLRQTGAATRPLTVEHPPPVVKFSLLPATLPSERCWRDDRLRINYELPMILPREELAIRLPPFLDEAGFELVENSPRLLQAERAKHFKLFDPRRAQHTLTIEPLEGALRAYYQMTRTQVYHWFPAHYRTLDREAAALFRYLATAELRGILLPTQRQARIARMLSWIVLVILVIAVLALGLLLADEVFELGLF